MKSKEAFSLKISLMLTEIIFSVNKGEIINSKEEVYKKLFNENYPVGSGTSVQD